MPQAAAPRHSRVIVLGSGPAGYTAAIYAARAMLEPVLIAGFEPGGQLMITTDVENYPGFAEPIQGPWLMDQMRAQAEHVGAKLVSDHIVKRELGRRPFELLRRLRPSLHLRRAHYRDGRQGQMAGPAERGGVQGFWRLRLRHLRRILLSRQEGYRRRRRQYGGRGGDLSLQHRRPCDAGASTWRTTLRAGFARAIAPPAQRRNIVRPRHRRDFRRRRSARRHACSRKKHAHGRIFAHPGRRSVRRHRPPPGLRTFQGPAHAETLRLHRRRARHDRAPTSPASSRRAMSPTKSTARR